LCSVTSAFAAANASAASAEVAEPPYHYRFQYHVQSERLKSSFQESQLLGPCSEIMLFPLDTLAKGTKYVDVFWKLAGKLSRQQLRLILIDKLLDGCYVQRVMDHAFAFFDLGSARGKGGNSDGGVRIADFVRSCLP
jgi:hypothetical protein